MTSFLTSYVLGSYSLGAALVGLLFGFAVYLIYNIGVYMNFGILKSISISYMKWTPWQNRMITFQAFMYASAASVFFINQTWWFLIVAILFGLMTTFPSVLYKDFIYPHSAFAISAIALGLIGLPVTYGPWFLIPCAVALVGDLLIALFVKQRPSDWSGDESETTKLYWIEQCSICTMMASFAVVVVLKLLNIL